MRNGSKKEKKKTSKSLSRYFGSSGVRVARRLWCDGRKKNGKCQSTNKFMMNQQKRTPPPDEEYIYG